MDIKLIKKIGIASLISLTVILLISSSYQFFKSKQAFANYPAPGKMIEIDGYKLHFNCIGKGEPAVILESGGGLFSKSWLLVQENLAQSAKTQVCSYDRAGMGWSEEYNGNYSIEKEVKALHTALIHIGVKNKFIYVGHSYGSFMAFKYAHLYKDQLSAMILVDPNTNYFFEKNPEVADTVISQSNLLKYATPLGLVRLLAYEDMSSNIRFKDNQDNEEMLDLIFTTKNLSSQAKMLNSFAKTVIDIRSINMDFKIPIIIISRGLSDNNFPWINPGRELDWRQGHKNLFEQYPNIQLVIAEKSTHMIIFDQPDVIVENIVKMINISRKVN